MDSNANTTQHLRLFLAAGGAGASSTRQAANIQRQLLACTDGELIASLEAILCDATFSQHHNAERVLDYHAAARFLQQLRQLRDALLREAIRANTPG